MDTPTALDEHFLVISDHPGDSEVGSESLPSVDEEILVIPEEWPSGRAPGHWWRVVRALCLGGAAAAVSLIVIFGIIGPAVRESRRKQCDEYLDQVGRALHEYHRVQGHLPAPALADREGKPLLSWRVAILPQLGYQSLYARFHLDESWDSPHNRALLREMPKEFACPGGPGPRAGQTGYLVVVGPKSEPGSVNTPFEPPRGAAFHEFSDGTSNTVLVIETDPLITWTKPQDLQWAPGGPLPPLVSPHDGGAHALFADGATKFLRSPIAATTLLALLTKNGGEVLSGG
jgi:prepilin-type processing-associated H-X9-DG protein